MTRRHFAEFLQSAVAVGAHFYLSLISCLALWALFPMLFGWTPTAVMSGSMEPTLKVGELVVAQPLSQDEIRSGMIRPGHVILADNPMDKGTLFTHRVMSIQPDGRFITKGDNNGTLDPEPLSPEGVKGIERMKVPLVGFPIHAVHSQNFLLLAAVVGLTAAAAAIVRRDKRRLEAKEVYSTRAEAKAARKRNRSFPVKALSSMATISALVAGLMVGGSTAAFSGSTGVPGNTWSAATTFGPSDPSVVSCGGATYQINPGSTLTCAVGTVSGTTTNYTLTVQGTGALVLWTVTADWSAVTKFQSAKAYGPGVTDTGTITQKTGYQIKGAANGCGQASACNHAYVSSTKAAEVFTVQIVRTA